MRGSLKIGTIKGIQIKLHWTFVFVLIWGASVFGGSAGLNGILYGLGLTGLIFIVVFLHELGHSLVAQAFHIRVQDITLFPLGGLARLEKMPSKPWQEFLVASAGPAVNFVMAVALSPVLILRLFSGQFGAFEWIFTPFQTPTVLGILQYLLMVNVILLVFNLIPAFPMDGGRMLRAGLALVLDPFYATRIAVWVGQGIAFIMVGYGLWARQWAMLFIGVYLFFAAGSEHQYAQFRHRLSRIRVSDVLPEWYNSLSPEQTVSDVAGTALRSAQSSFPVMRDGVLLGILRRETVQAAISNGSRWATVADVMEHDVPRVFWDDTLEIAREKLQAAKSPAGAVYYGDEFKGVIDFEEMTRAYRFNRSSSQRWGVA